MTVRQVALLVVIALVAAGCTSDPDGAPGRSSGPQGPGEVTDDPTGPSGPAGPGDPGGPGTGDPGASGQVVDFGTGCEQLHAIFASPRAGVDWGLPDGWTTTSVDEFGLTDSVFVYPTRCDQGSHAWVLLGVEPPPALQDAEVDLEYWVVQLVESDPALASALSAVGFPVAEGTADLEQQGNAELWAIESEAGARYTMASVVGEGTGDDFLVVQRFWTMGPEAPVALRVVITTAEDRGMGTVAFASEGDANAPPVLPGIAHRIGAMSYAASWDDAGSVGGSGAGDGFRSDAEATR